MEDQPIKVCGVICEYNPFHIGHRYHLHQGKKQSQADLVVCLLSGPFTQRGSAALFQPATRAHMALLNGADVVFELPTIYALREAEHFAAGSISLFAKLGIDGLSFGCETTDLTFLRQVSAFLNAPPQEYSDRLKSLLSLGLSFPKAQSEALAPFFTKEQVLAFAHPNNILAIAYLRAIDKFTPSMKTYPLLRRGSYHASHWEDNEVFPSATALRSAISRGDWQQIKPMMPQNCHSLLGEALFTQNLHLPQALDLPLLYYLRSLTPGFLMTHFDVEPGLDYKIIEGARRATSRQELIEHIKSKRYTYARINRLLSQILLLMDKQLWINASLPPLRLLGFRNHARPWLKTKKDFYYTKAANAHQSPSFLLDMRAYDLWALGANLPSGLGYRSSPVVLD